MPTPEEISQWMKYRQETDPLVDRNRRSIGGIPGGSAEVGPRRPWGRQVPGFGGVQGEQQLPSRSSMSDPGKDQVLKLLIGGEWTDLPPGVTVDIAGDLPPGMHQMPNGQMMPDSQMPRGDRLKDFGLSFGGSPPAAPGGGQKFPPGTLFLGPDGKEIPADMIIGENITIEGKDHQAPLPRPRPQGIPFQELDRMGQPSRMGNEMMGGERNPSEQLAGQSLRGRDASLLRMLMGR